MGKGALKYMLKEKKVSKDMSDEELGKSPRSPVLKIASATFFLGLLLAIGLFWLIIRQVEQNDSLVERLDILETTRSSISQDSNFNRNNLTELLDSQSKALDNALKRIELYQSRNDQKLIEVQKSVESNKLALNDFSASKSYLLSLAEVAHLLRVANERLSILNDIDSAKAMLIKVDKILLDLNRTELDYARQSLSRDLTSLRTQKNTDIHGLLGRISALIALIDSFEIPALSAPSSGSVTHQESGSKKNNTGFSLESELDRLSEFITIKKSDKNYEKLFDPQFEVLVRKNIRTLLQQAQIAVLTRDSILFKTVLEQASFLVGEFQFLSDDVVLKLRKDLEALRTNDIAQSRLDLSGSIDSIEKVLRRNLAEEKD